LTWRERGGEAWGRFRALPVVWQGAALVLALVALLWLYGALDGAIAGARDWFTDREVRELREANEQLARERQALAEQVATERGRREQIERELHAKEAELKALADEGRQQDANIVTTRKRYEDARRGRARRPDTGEWPDEGLRDLYGTDPQR
jgi:septal ring factor EnvC (AmiA/AmiB activator)